MEMKKKKSELNPDLALLPDLLVLSAKEFLWSAVFQPSGLGEGKIQV
jgi:hypothetical protein